VGFTRTAGVGSATVKVTVTNTGGQTGHWKAVNAAITGTNLNVNVLGSSVTLVLRPGAHCFYANAASGIDTVPAGGSVSFSFTEGLLATVNSVALDTSPCT
jgi:hypothetical protein